MSFPNVPTNINPNINLPTDQIANLLLASIAFEELGLAHIINAEAEKIQYVLGTLENQTTDDTAAPTINELIKIDQTVDKILKDVIKKEIILQFKLENVLEITSTTTTTSTTTSTTTTTTSTTRRP